MTQRELPEWPEPPAYSTVNSWSRETVRANFNGSKVDYWESRCREAVEALKQAIECDTIGGAAGKCWNALSRIGPLPQEDKP